jgi:hypothetical protein
VTDVWLDALHVHPLPTPLVWDDPVLLECVRPDLLEEPSGSLESLRETPDTSCLDGLRPVFDWRVGQGSEAYRRGADTLLNMLGGR